MLDILVTSEACQINFVYQALAGLFAYPNCKCNEVANVSVKFL